MKTTKVLKFGGSSFPALSAYDAVAAAVESRLASDADRVILVVSAMSGTTGRILEAALAVNPDLSPEITDSILGTGEIVAACLMRAALERRGIPADHASGFQAGIWTDSRFTRAKPVFIDDLSLARKFQDRKVLVVSGGQAIDARGRMTMMGRNSSDLSAVILAAAFGLPECEIFSDVPGVYSADPYEVEDAAPIAEVPYDAIIALSRGGAKVLHHGAVEYARNQGIRIVCRATSSGEVGSVIGCGPVPAAVATNSKIAVFRFGSAPDREKARLKLEGEGIVAIVVDDPIVRLAVSKENRGWEQALLSVEVPRVEERGWSLLTTVDPSAGVRRRLVREDLRLEEARRAHAALRPFAGTPGRTPELAKSRAFESGLLL